MSPDDAMRGAGGRGGSSADAIRVAVRRRKRRREGAGRGVVAGFVEMWMTGGEENN